MWPTVGAVAIDGQSEHVHNSAICSIKWMARMVVAIEKLAVGVRLLSCAQACARRESSVIGASQRHGTHVSYI